jgi:hypothetical protein
MNNKCPIIYAWLFESYNDPGEPFMSEYLQLSILKEDVQLFIDEVLGNASILIIKLTSVPATSPHHLDVATEIIQEPRVEFSTFTLSKVQSATPIKCKCNTSNRSLLIEVNEIGLSTLIDAARYSTIHAYFAENQIDATIEIDEFFPFESKINFWSSCNEDIIYI